MKRIICLLLSISLIGVGLMGCANKTEKPHGVMAEIFVSPFGDDNNIGTKESPFLTIE